MSRILILTTAVAMFFIPPPARLAAQPDAPPAEDVEEGAVQGDADPHADETAAAADEPPSDPAAGEEPPLEFTLEIDGEQVPVALDQDVEIDVNGKPVRLKLTAKPDRLFRGVGVSFRYPRQHAFSVEPGEEGSTTWTFDGDDNVLVLVKIPAVAPPADVTRDMAQMMTEQFGRKNVKVGQSILSLAGKPMRGTRLTMTIGGQKHVSDLYAFNTADATFVLTVQDTPADDGTTSAETTRTRALLEETFRFE
jgi:hypothetical protein